MDDMVSIAQWVFNIGFICAAFFGGIFAWRNRGQTEKKVDQSSFDTAIAAMKHQHDEQMDKMRASMLAQVTNLQSELDAERAGRKADKDDMLERHTELVNQVSNLTERVEKLSVEKAELKQLTAEQQKQIADLTLALAKSDSRGDAMLEFARALSVIIQPSAELPEETVEPPKPSQEAPAQEST